MPPRLPGPFVFDLHSLREFAGLPLPGLVGPPVGRTLQQVLQPLRRVRPLPPPVRVEQRRSGRRRTQVVNAQEVLRNNPVSPVRWQWMQSQFAATSLRRSTLETALEQYSRRLPRMWVELVSSTWDVYERRFRDLPFLLDAMRSLILVEGQLQVSAEKANRDHILHQLADGFMGARLAHLLEDDGAPGEAGRAADFEVVGLERCLRRLGLGSGIDCTALELWEAGLCVAGLFHDVGYVRYVAESGLQAMRDVFQHPVSGVSPRDAEGLASLFMDSHIVEMLAAAYEDDDVELDAARARALALVLDLYDHGWQQKNHGPLSATILLEAAQRLRLDARQTPGAEAVLQLAATAAFAHELHPLRKRKKGRQLVLYPAVAEFLSVAGQAALPLIFRMVDELQCWYRPCLVPSPANRVGAPPVPGRFGSSDRATYLSLGANRVEITEPGGRLALCFVRGGDAAWIHEETAEEESQGLSRLMRRNRWFFPDGYRVRRI